MSHPILQGLKFSVYITYLDGSVENRRGFPTREAAQQHIDKFQLVGAGIMEWRPLFKIAEEEV